MEFLPDISKGIQVLLRWGHVFFAILWIGTSMTFNFLDNKMRKNIKNEEEVDLEGTLQHSGYYYKLTRYLGAPKEIPKNVIIWKWPSYLTFWSGLGLLIIIYYTNDFLMIDKRINEIVTHLMAVSISIFCSMWIGLFFYSVLEIRNYESIGLVLTGVMFVSVWICDSAAYIFGKKFGKKKIAPKISPKKTWVGSLSGLFFSLLFVFGFYYNHWFDYDLTWFSKL